MNKMMLILLVVISNHFICNGQLLNPYIHGVALSELTTFADSPGFKDEVIIEKGDSSIKWEVGEDGYVYTKDIEHTTVFAFKSIYSKEDIFIVTVYYSSTGSAELSYILKVQLTDEKLILKEVITGGDRCQEGADITRAKIENETLFYSHYITPQHLMSWYNNLNNNSYADCMICCCGFANYKYDLKNSKKVFQDILLPKEYLPNNESFQKAYNDFVANEDLKLSLSIKENELKEFIMTVTTYNKN
jgi:hypothetical protein